MVSTPCRRFVLTAGARHWDVHTKIGTGDSSSRQGCRRREYQLSLQSLRRQRIRRPERRLRRSSSSLTGASLRSRGCEFVWGAGVHTVCPTSVASTSSWLVSECRLHRSTVRTVLEYVGAVLTSGPIEPSVTGVTVVGGHGCVVIGFPVAW